MSFMTAFYCRGRGKVEQMPTYCVRSSPLWKVQLIPTAGLLQFVILLCREAELKFQMIKQHDQGTQMNRNRAGIRSQGLVQPLKSPLGPSKKKGHLPG